MSNPEPYHDYERLRRHTRSLARSIARGDEHLADDLEQATLLVALQSRPRSEDSLRPWLLSICVNTLRRGLRRNRTLGEPNDEEIPSDEVDPLNLALDDEMRRELRSAVRRLPPLQSEAIELRFLHGLSAVEVAERLDIPVETARTRIKRGLTALRAKIDDSAEDGWARRFGAVVLAGFEPIRRRLRSLALVASVGLAAWVGVAMLDSDPVLERDSVVAPAETDGLAAPKTVNRAGPRVAAAEFASVRVSASASLAEYWKLGVHVALSGEDGTVHVARIGPDTTDELRGLTPGTYEAKIGALVVARRQLDVGPQEWELTLDSMPAFDVRVVDVMGSPADGAEVFERTPGSVQPRLLGRTDAAGRLSVEVTSSESWIAARGAPGAVSESVPIGHTSRHATGEVALTLGDQPVHWTQITIPEDPALEGAVVRWLNCGIRAGRGVEWGRGLHETADWLPPWRDALGAYGFCAQFRGWRIELVGDDQKVHWMSPMIEGGSPPPSTLSVGARHSIRARLVDDEGRPFRHLYCDMRPYRNYDRIFVCTHTDAQGRVEFSTRWNLERSAIGALGKAAWILNPSPGMDPDESSIEDVGDLVLPAEEAVLYVFRIVGARGPVVASPVYGDAGPEESIGAYRPLWCSLDVPDQELFELPATYGTLVGVRFECTPDDPTEPSSFRFIDVRTERASEEPIAVDFETTQTTSVKGRVAAAALPCTGYLYLRPFEHSIPVSIDPVSGRFSADGLPPGEYSVHAFDARGRALSGAAPLQCLPGETGDFGVLDATCGVMRVSIPNEVSADSALGFGELDMFSGWRSLARQRVTRADLARGWVDVEAPVGSYFVVVTLEGTNYLGRATVEEGKRTDCSVASDLVGVSMLIEPRVIDQFPDLTIEILDHDGHLIQAAEADELLELGAPQVVILCPRVQRMTVAKTAGGISTKEETWVPATEGVHHVKFDSPLEDPAFRFQLERDMDRELSTGPK
ncbi:MAG: sigma-70 family RNA polymerase sigma factor [Planctomycetota bacterium]